MATKKKLLQAAAGTASAAGGGALNVEDVFSIDLWEGMGENFVINNDIKLADDREEKTLIYITGNGSIVDSGPYGISLTNSAVTVNTSTKKFGTGSLYFSGSNTTLTATSSRLPIGFGDFTVEFWLNLPDASGTFGIFNIGNSGDFQDYNVGLFHSNNGLTFQYRNNPNDMGQFSVSTGSSTIGNNTWHHIACVRHNDYIKIYIDGTHTGGTTDVGGTFVTEDHLELGTHWDNTYCFTGYIDDFRVSKRAVYTENFTAPTAEHGTSYTSVTGEGGLVWAKSRTGSYKNSLFDTERGVSKCLVTNSNAAEVTETGVVHFNGDGFTVGSWAGINQSGHEDVGWTFRKAPKFFDIVTWTGDGTAGRQIPHNLGSVPGFITVKMTNAQGDWVTYHRTTGETKAFDINSGAGAYGPNSVMWNNTAPTDTHFTLGSYGNVNSNGNQFVAYLFAHNNSDGDFGPNGDQDIIKCDSYTGTGSTNLEVDLGFEPQWVMIKNAGQATDWNIWDARRGVHTNANDPYLAANQANNEGALFNVLNFTPTGFTVKDTNTYINSNGHTYVYIAIRRPTAVPTDARKVFDAQKGYNCNANNVVFPTQFPVDTYIYKDRFSANNNYIKSYKLPPQAYLRTDTNDNEVIGGAYANDFQRMNGIYSDGAYDFTNWVAWLWKRAPHFFEEVCYTGSGGARTIQHNLGITPEMIWVKERSQINDWRCWHKDLTSTERLQLNSTSGKTSTSTSWNATLPTDTVFSVGNDLNTNESGQSYIAYLFGSVDGVAKIGSLTTQSGGTTVDCGFSSSPRFVLLKRLDASSGWNVFDADRGIVAGNDPYLDLNNTNLENTSADLIDPTSSGFSLTTAWSNGQNWMYYAIA